MWLTIRHAGRMLALLSFLNKYAGNVHSQNGEDFVIREALRRIGLTVGHAVEVGGNNGLWLSNTRHLVEQGWDGLFIEADYNLYLQSKSNWSNNPRVRSQCCRVDERNINAFVDERCDVLSIDVDGSDYKIFQGLRAKPKIVIVEIDSSIEPPSEQFNSDGGASYWTMTVAGLEKGYFLLVHCGNVVMILNEYRTLFPEIVGDGLSNFELYFNTAWLSSK